MTSGADLARCYAFVSCQLNPPAPSERHALHRQLRPALAISRQTGCSSKQIAEKLAELLQTRHPAPCGWTIFDKNIVAKMLEEHHLPAELARFVPEDRVPLLRDMMEQVLGLHPPSETLISQVGETVRRLAEMGHVILLGRASNVITRSMSSVFQVRLVAPLEQRAARVMAQGGLNHEAAAEYIRKEDSARKRYVKEYFKADLDDPMLYDLVVNTARLSPDETAKLIGEAIVLWAKSG
jgi:hypothetical protein